VANRVTSESRKFVQSASIFAEDGLWTAKELEDLLKIDVKTIYGYVQRGLIPYVRIQSNVRFPKCQIREWIEKRSFTPK
jgi:excisionase family DNA binding protein